MSYTEVEMIKNRIQCGVINIHLLTALSLRLNTIRNPVAHMNFRLDLRFPHRKHCVRFTLGIPIKRTQANLFINFLNFNYYGKV